MLARIPRHQIQQKLANGRVLFGLSPHELDHRRVAGKGFTVHDDGVEQCVETGVLEIGAADAFGEYVEADEVGVGGDGCGEGGGVEPVLEPVEDGDVGEGVGQRV